MAPKPQIDTLIFHSADGQNHCDDGFAAALLFYLFPEGSKIDFVPGVYGKQPPWDLIKGRHVALVDFSYKRPMMEQIIDAATSVLVLDHHKTAKAELDGLISTGDDPDWPRGDNLTMTFDMERSGARLAWDYLYPGFPCPDLVARIEDNDLWRDPRRYEDSLLVQAALRAYPQTFEVWTELLGRPIEELAEEGVAIRRFIEAKVIELKRTAWIGNVGGHLMPVCNCPWFLASELAGQLAEDDKDGRAAVYFDQGDRRCYSLRARNGADVLEIAKRYGGGGHEGAAGFEVPK